MKNTCREEGIIIEHMCIWRRRMRKEGNESLDFSSLSWRVNTE